MRYTILNDNLVQVILCQPLVAAYSRQCATVRVKALSRLYRLFCNHNIFLIFSCSTFLHNLKSLIEGREDQKHTFLLLTADYGNVHIKTIIPFSSSSL